MSDFFSCLKQNFCRFATAISPNSLLFPAFFSICLVTASLPLVHAFETHNMVGADVDPDLQRVQRLQQIAQLEQLQRQLDPSSASTAAQQPSAGQTSGGNEQPVFSQEGQPLLPSQLQNGQLPQQNFQPATQQSQMPGFQQQQMQPSSPMPQSSYGAINNAAIANQQVSPGMQQPVAANGGMVGVNNTAAAMANVPTQQMVSGVNQQEPYEAVRETAFKDMTRELLPMTPEQIQRLHQQFKSTQFATETDPNTPPRPVASSKEVSLAPGVTPPVIRLAQGFVSSLVFVDSTGAPWPIKAYDLGDPGSFNIQWDKKSNTLMIQATKLYTYGNLAVELEKLPTPVMITLVPGQKAVDYRADLRIQGFGPNAKDIPRSKGLPESANPVLLGILDGVPPSGSSTLQVLGGNAQAWRQGEKLFLRTRLTLLSPSWTSTMTSADGTKAYELQSAPTLLAFDNGKVVQLTLKRFDE